MNYNSIQINFEIIMHSFHFEKLVNTKDNFFKLFDTFLKYRIISCFFKVITEIHFTQHNTHPLKVYSLAIFSIFRVLKKRKIPNRKNCIA